MATLTVIYWRDIPSQVIARGPAGTAKAMLPTRFQAAVDRAAAVAGQEAEDAYLAAWRRVERPCGDDVDAEVAAEVARLEDAFPPERLTAVIAAGGAVAGA